MTRLIIALGLASTLLSPAVLASNAIFGFSPSDPTCTACLDNAFLACPGFYQDRSYAECMCGGVGDTEFVTCTSTSCDPGVNSPANAARMWYNYCTQFFPAELCPGAESYMNPDIYQDQCNAAAIAGGGLGSGGSSGSGSSGSGSGSGAGSGTGSGSDSGSASATSSSRVTSTPTDAASGAGFTSGTTSSSKPSGSSGANAIMIPAGGVLGVLGIQLVNLLM